MPTLEPGKLPALTDAQVQAGAHPGESWVEARRRLEAANWACPPPPDDMDPGADCLLSGWISDRGLEGEPIEWQPGELDGEPLIVVDPANPWREFNADADRFQAERDLQQVLTQRAMGARRMVFRYSVRTYLVPAIAALMVGEDGIEVLEAYAEGLEKALGQFAAGRAALLAWLEERFLHYGRVGMNAYDASNRVEEAYADQQAACWSPPTATK